MYGRNIIIFFVGLLLFASLVAAQDVPRDITSEEVKGASGENLRSLIESKTSELQKIQEERERLQTELREVSKIKGVLTKDIRAIENNIKQLDLSVKSNKLTLEKLELEIESLNKDMKSVEESVVVKKSTIGKLIFELDQMDQETFLMVFLKSGSLAEGFSELQSIVSFNSDLVLNVRELRDFQSDILLKSASVQRKKMEREAEKGNLLNRQYIVQDQKKEKEKLLLTTKNQEQVYAGQIAELDRQQGEISKVIDQIEATLRESFDPTLLPIKRAGVLAFPVQNPRVTQKYGSTPDAQKLYKSKIHNGIDFGVPLGTPVYASYDGKVVAVDNNDKGISRFQKYQYGKHIVIEHQNSLATLYAHLSRQVVTKGQEVKKGELIGYSGNTGYSTGPHLHFTVLWAPSVQYKKIAPAAGLVPIGITIDPEEYL